MATPTAAPDRSSEAPIASLELGLVSLARRMRLLRAVRGTARGVIAGSCVALALLALSHFGQLPLLLDLFLPIGIVSVYGLSIGIGLLIASRKRIDSLALARFAEQQMDVKERFSSALTLEDRNGDVLVRMQRADASHYAGRIEPRALIPWRWTWELTVASVSVILVLLAALIPASPLSVASPERVARAEMIREATKLDEVARQVLRQSDQTAPPAVKESARRLQKIARAMQSHQATKAQAVHDLQQLSEQIKQANRQAAGSSSSDAKAGGQDKSAQARADAQRELDRALSSDSKGSDGISNDRQKSSAGNKGTAGTNGTAKSGTGENGKSSATSSQSGSTGNPSASQSKPTSANGQKQTGSKSSAQTGAQSGENGAAGKPGATTAKPGSVSPKSGTSSAKPGGTGTKPGQSAQAGSSQQSPQKSASAPGAPSTFKPGSTTQSKTPSNASQKPGKSPTGKEYGTSAPPGPHQGTPQQSSGGELMGDKLRRYADKIAQRPMASGEREQAAGSLDQLNQKLNDANMPETQKHVQAAAQALREGRQQDAVSELRKAADAADRETPVTERQESQSSQSSSQSSSSNGGQGSPQNGPSQQLQRAVDQSKQNLSGQKPGQSGGKSEQGAPSEGQPGQRSGKQAGSQNIGPGSGKPYSAPVDRGDTAHVHGGGSGPGGDHKTAAPLPFGKLSAGGSGKIALKPLITGGRMIEKPVPGKELPGAVPSVVPYYKVLPQFKKAAEKDAGAENIPPAYRQQVKKYFDSLTPAHQ